MPGQLASSRPIFYEAETFNGVADLGSLHRRLVQWVRWTYARDGYYKPCDPAPDVRDVSTVDAADFGLGSGSLGSFYVPQPTTPIQRLVLHLLVDLVNSSGWVDLKFTGTRGNEKTVRVDYAALGSQTSGWYSFTFPCAPDSVVQVDATASGSSIAVKSLCGWWEPLSSGGGIVVPSGALSFPSRTWAAQDRPDATYFLRSLAQLANRYGAKRPRMVVAKSYLNTQRRSAGTFTIGTYRVWVSKNVDTLKARFLAKYTTVNYTFRAYEDGTQVASTTASSPGSWVVLTVPITKGSARVVEVKVTAQADATNSILDFMLQEEPVATADLGLASGDTVPSSFPALDPNAGRGGAPIMATGQGGRAGILDALIWLYAKRYRILVGDGLVAPDTNVTTNWLGEYLYGPATGSGSETGPFYETARAAARKASASYDVWGEISVNGTSYYLSGAVSNAAVPGYPEPAQPGRWFSTCAPTVSGGSARLFSYAHPNPIYTDWVGCAAEVVPQSVP